MLRSVSPNCLFRRINNLSASLRLYVPKNHGATVTHMRDIFQAVTLFCLASKSACQAYICINNTAANDIVFYSIYGP